MALYWESLGMDDGKDGVAGFGYMPSDTYLSERAHNYLPNFSAWTNSTDNERKSAVKEYIRGYKKGFKNKWKSHYGEEYKIGWNAQENPASSAAQYRLAQAVLSGAAKSTGMTKKVAQEIVERTPAKLRSEWAKANPDGSPAYKAGVAWLKNKVRTAKGSFITTPGAVAYLKKMGYEGTLDIPKHSPSLMYTQSVRDRVEKAREMYDDFLNGANAAWEQRLHDHQHTEENPPSRSGPITSATRSLSKIGAYATRPITKAGEYVDRGIGQLIGHNGKRKRKGKRNPESDAQSMFEAFHGRASSEIAEFIEEEHYHGNLAELGQLIELKVETVTGLDVTFNFEYEGKPEKGVILASNESGTSLYFVGGDQAIDLDEIEMADEEHLKDSMVIGSAYFVSYFTEKDFDNFEPTIYEHELGEETEELPTLRYDSLNKRLYLDGGAYIIKKPMFRTSDGIEN
jgi:hypothetical protein